MVDVTNISPCTGEHDPRPYVTESMAVSAQTTWRRTRLRPREGYCQRTQCYEQGLHKSTLGKSRAEEDETHG